MLILEDTISGLFVNSGVMGVVRASRVWVYGLGTSAFKTLELGAMWSGVEASTISGSGFRGIRFEIIHGNTVI